MNPEYLELKELLDQRILSLASSCISKENPLFEAINYGISTPGKRIRGVLTMAFCRRMKICDELSVHFALALELIHAYSLIHDDMPEMDNDDYRRGLPTCHKKFGADVALLAGDAVLNLSIEYLLSKKEIYHPEAFLSAMSVLYKASGAKGMLCGQALDKAGEEKKLSFEQLLELHRAKTGALLLAPALIAQALSGSTNDNYVNYSRHIGLAFQIKDDILDVEGNRDTLGKSIGKDLAENKSTFISLLGIDEAKKYLATELNSSIKYADHDPFLEWLANYVGKRSY